MTLTALTVRLFKILLRIMTLCLPLRRRGEVVSIILAILCGGGIKTGERAAGVRGRRRLCKGEVAVGHDAGTAEEFGLRTDAGHGVWVIEEVTMLLHLEYGGHRTVVRGKGSGERREGSVVMGVDGGIMGRECVLMRVHGREVHRTWRRGEEELVGKSGGAEGDVMAADAWGRKGGGNWMARTGRGSLAMELDISAPTLS